MVFYHIQIKIKLFSRNLHCPCYIKEQRKPPWLSYESMSSSELGLSVCREGIALKGKPELSWDQPESRCHCSWPFKGPDSRSFLGGQLEKLVYKNFNGLPAAQAWSYKHRASGCYMKVILGSRSGTGKNAYCVEIVKTTQGYKSWCLFTIKW